MLFQATTVLGICVTAAIGNSYTTHLLGTCSSPVFLHWRMNSTRLRDFLYRLDPCILAGTEGAPHECLLNEGRQREAVQKEERLVGRGPGV